MRSAGDSKTKKTQWMVLIKCHHHINTSTRTRTRQIMSGKRKAFTYMVISSTRLCDDDDMAVMGHGEQIRGSVNTHKRCGDLPDPPLAISRSSCDCRGRDGRRGSGYDTSQRVVSLGSACSLGKIGPGSFLALIRGQKRDSKEGGWRRTSERAGEKARSRRKYSTVQTASRRESTAFARNRKAGLVMAWVSGAGLV